MQIKSSIKERILQHIDNHRISKYEFYKKTGITRGVLSKKNGISEENIMKYIAYYPEINPEWLLTGRGRMLRLVGRKAESPPVALQADYDKDQGLSPAVCKTCEEKDSKIQDLQVRLSGEDGIAKALESQLEEVKHRLADKDMQIEDLRNNLERLILAKDRLINIQEGIIEELKSKVVLREGRKVA